MTRGQLPKPYLRLDPDIDQKHPERLDDFIRLMCTANRQVPRGRFRSRAVLESLFGKPLVAWFYARGDVADLDDGKVIVPGWDGWQEGDMTVAERMARLRSKAVTTPSLDRDDDVSEPSPDRSTPLKGVKASRHKTFSSPDGEGAASPRPPSQARLVKAWLTEHDLALPVGWENAKLNELARLGAPKVIAAFEEARAAGGAVTTRNYLRWAEQVLAPDPSPRNGGTNRGHTRPAQEAIDAFNR